MGIGGDVFAPVEADVAKDFVFASTASPIGIGGRNVNGIGGALHEVMRKGDFIAGESRFHVGGDFEFHALGAFIEGILVGIGRVIGSAVFKIEFFVAR